MERRDFLKLAFGVAAGTAALAVSAQAAPLSPQPIDEPNRQPDAHPAVADAVEAAQLEPEQVQWHRHRRWHRPHWGSRRRWHRRRRW